MSVPSRPGRVRIISGSLKNSRLQVPVQEGLRPTPERVRETLFNWLTAYLPGLRCLDLFAGTGALGIEALSRGAAAVDFIEANAVVAVALRENLRRLRQDDGAVRCADALTFLDGPARAYGLVFLDPPFAAGLWDEAAAALEGRGWLTRDAWIYVEHLRGQARFLPSTWQSHRSAAAGEIAYALYRRSPQLG